MSFFKDNTDLKREAVKAYHRAYYLSHKHLAIKESRAKANLRGKLHYHRHKDRLRAEARERVRRYRKERGPRILSADQKARACRASQRWYRKNTARALASSLAYSHSAKGIAKRLARGPVTPPPLTPARRENRHRSARKYYLSHKAICDAKAKMYRKIRIEKRGLTPHQIDKLNRQEELECNALLRELRTLLSESGY